MSPKIDNLSSANSIAKAQRFIQRHFYLLLLIPLFIIIIPITKPGISITGDFPYLDSPDYAAKRLSMWIETGSIDGFEFLPRFPILGMWELLGYIHLTTEIGTKVMIVLGFLLSSFSFYFSFLKFFQGKFLTLNFKLKISAILGSIFYAYNIWSFNRVHHWYLWIGYALFPIFFVSVLYSIKDTKHWKYIISAVFFWSIASSTPHMAVFYGIALIVSSLGFVFSAVFNHKSKGHLIRLVIPAVLIIVFYLLVNLYWIYPYFIASKAGAINPNYEFTEENINLLSRYSNFLNTLRGMAYWINLEVIRAYDHTNFFDLWQYASFVVPVVAFLTLISKRSLKQSIIFSSVAVIGIFFAMGTRSPVNYYDLMLSTPVLDKLVWLLRDPDKMTFLIAFAYSFLVGLFSFKFLSIFVRNKNNKINLVVSTSFVILLIGSISITGYPYYKARLAPLEPIILPEEFDKLNKYLSSVNPYRVYFAPYPMEETQWDKNGRVATIYQTHSIKPSIESTEYNLGASNYYNFLESYVMGNKSKDVSNLLFPLGTSYLIYHNDTWSRTLDKPNVENIKLLNKLRLLNDIKNVKDIGFFKIFKTNGSTGSESVGEVNIPSQKMFAVGGLDAYASLNSLTSFNSLKSSVQFSDNILLAKNIGFQDPDQLIMYGSQSYDDLALSFVDDKYVIVPIQSTIRDDPATSWSKSSTSDPINAEFHTRLRSLGISNWDFDYGKGLVITKSMGANISIPVNVHDSKSIGDSKVKTVQLFVRIFENQKGGAINVYFDGKLTSQVDTYDKISNNFKWVNLGSLNATSGKHTLTMQNVAGFNAVNIFAIIPPDEMAKIRSETSSLFKNKTQIAYLMEAESSFRESKGDDTGMSQFLYEENETKSNQDRENTHGKNIEGQFSVPNDADLATIKFDMHSNNNTSLNNQALTAIVNIYPSKIKHSVYSAEFELNKNNISIPLGKLRQLEWLNYDKDIVSTTIDGTSHLDGNYSLSVNTNASQKDGWNIISTDFIPIHNDRYYNASLRISASDVSQLHSRILYFDSEKRLIAEGTEYVFREHDGTFRDNFASSILPPLNARYLKLQVLTLSDNPKPSKYVVDDVKLDEISIPKSTYKNALALNLESKKDALLNNTGQINSINKVVETELFTVDGGKSYKYAITLSGNMVDQNSILISFKNSSGITKSTKYGINSSQGEVLSLRAGSEIAGDLTILKPSNYTLAIKARMCESCTFLSAHIVRKNDNGISDNLIQNSTLDLKANVSRFDWLTSNDTFLTPGAYKIRIHSNSQTDLDAVVLYSDDRIADNPINKVDNDKLGLFGINESLPSSISSYNRIDSTKHVVAIKNATRPYIISFTESYDPYWTAYSIDSNTKTALSDKDTNFRVNSIPLYGVTNGFYINKTGNYNLVIEYEPQKWFIQGSIASTISVIAILLLILFVIQKEILIWPYLQIVTKMKRQR